MYHISVRLINLCIYKKYLPCFKNIMYINQTFECSFKKNSQIYSCIFCMTKTIYTCIGPKQKDSEAAGMPMVDKMYN